MIQNRDCEISYIFFYLTILFHIIIFYVICWYYYRNRRLQLNIVLVNSLHQCKSVCNIIENECMEFKCIGIDAEWVTIGRRRQPVALIQLCSPKGTCGLFRLNNLKLFPQPLRSLLENEKIVKVGVVPDKDAGLLFTDYEVLTKSTLDLRYLYNVQMGLAGLANLVLGIKLEKNYKVQCSNWEADILSKEQVKYSAMDAYVAIEIFKKWTYTGNNSEYKLFKKYSTWREIEGKIFEFIDRPFGNKNNGTTKNKTAKQNKKSVDDNLTKLKTRFAIKKPTIYDKCFMRAPDDTLLCTLRKSKALWYLNRGKAELLSEDPYTIRLLFEPKKKPTASEHLYDKELKSDICVVCGATSYLLKHNVVPKLYSKHFPVSMKSHCSHDILLFCVKCHIDTGARDRSLMQLLEKRVTGTSDECDPVHKTAIKELTHFRSYAKALLHYNNSIPDARRNQMQSEIKLKYNVVEVTQQLLMEIMNKTLADVGDTKSRGELVVQYYSTGGRKISDLQRLWRKHFVSYMQPQYLPKHWAIDHEN